MAPTPKKKTKVKVKPRRAQAKPTPAPKVKAKPEPKKAAPLRSFPARGEGLDGAIVKAPAFVVAPDEVRLSIDAASLGFGVPGRTIRGALGDGTLSGYNYGGQTGWLTTPPAMRSFLRGLERPTLLMEQAKRIEELEAEVESLKAKLRRAKAA